MFRFLRLLKYILTSQKEFIKLTILLLLITIVFLLFNFIIFIITTFQAEHVSILKFSSKGFFHVIIVSILFVRCAYVYLSNKLFFGLYEDNEGVIFDSMNSFLIENEKAQKLSIQTEDNYFLKINNWVDKLPLFLRKIVKIGLSFVPFYDMYQTSLTKDLTHEERVAWLIDEIKEDLKERFSVRSITVWMILIPLINWSILFYYWLM